MLVKIAKGFKFSNPVANTLTFQGPVLLDEQFLYLVHNSHTWDSAGTSVAMFGLLGAAIHHFTTRNKPVPYPYETTPYSELKHHLEQAYKIGKVKDTAQVMQLPRSAVRGYSTGMLKATQLLCTDGPITLHGVVREIKAIFQEHGVLEA